MKPHADEKKLFSGVMPILQRDDDPQETAEWLESLDFVCHTQGRERAQFLLEKLRERAFRIGVPFASSATTPYINTIPVELQPAYPGDREIERRIKSIIRWNAMAMVVRANKNSHGIGGHLSTYASAATLYEVAFNHFFRGKQGKEPPDQVFFQGHAVPGIYSRAFLLGRLTERNLVNFRRELQRRRRAVVLSASLAYARLLGVPHGLDGPGADHGHLPGPLQPLPGRSRHQARRHGLAGLGLPGRRRVRRAGNAGRDHLGLPRGSGQSDLRHQLQPAAAGRSGPRQRQDRAGTGRGVPRRRLERNQGPVGLRLGPPARQGQRRPVDAPHGRGRRRPVAEVLGHARLVRPRALLRR